MRVLEYIGWRSDVGYIYLDRFTQKFQTLSAPLAGETVFNNGLFLQIAEEDIPVESLSITSNINGTVDITIAENGEVTVTVSGAAYAHHNGPFAPFDPSVLDGGPHRLAAPVITGVAGTNEVLTAAPGLWVSDTADGPAIITGDWQRAGGDIDGETELTYTTGAADKATSVTYQESATNSAGTRTADSNAIAIPDSGVVFFDDFTSYSDGESLATPANANYYRYTAQNGGAQIDGSADTLACVGGNGQDGIIYVGQTLADDQYVEMGIKSATGSYSDAVYPQARMVDGNNCIRLWIAAGQVLQVLRFIGGVKTNIRSIGFALSPDDVVRMEVIGDTVTVYVNGALKTTVSDAALAPGGALESGQAGFFTQAASTLTDPAIINSFGCGDT